MRNSSVVYVFHLDQRFRRRCRFKIFLMSLALFAIFYDKATNLGKISIGYPAENFCKIILNLDMWFRERCL